MVGEVFVLKDSQTLVQMRSASFATEDDFQRLLAEFPALLSGNQIDEAAPRRWLLVSREKSIASEADGGARWSLDHLFLDQDGIPTLVEVKRQSDTRLRREVIGQILEYAANAVVYWPVEEIRAAFEARCSDEKTDPEQEIRSRLELEGDVEGFWQRVKTNLKAGRIRILLVADLIPTELRRIVEFLNEQMDPAEFLALELRQYEGEGMRTLVPIVYGQTVEARDRKTASGPRRQWDEVLVFEDLERRTGNAAVEVAKEIVAWMHRNADEVAFGQGTRTGSISAVITRAGGRFVPFAIYSDGTVTLNFGAIKKGPFADEAKRKQWLGRLNEIDGVNLAADAIDRYFPSIKLDVLTERSRLAKFLGVMDWFMAELGRP